MDAFFSRYRNFIPDPNISIIDNFERLAVFQNWAPAGRARGRAYRNFRSAMVEEFNITYGTEDNNLDSWKNLCRVVDIDPIPETTTQCRKAVRKRHVNLVDLIDNKRSGGQVKVFGNLRQLRDYTRETGKYFPKNPAKGGGILKSLLREMNASSED